MFKLLGVGLIGMLLLNVLFMVFFVPINVVVTDSMVPTYRTGDLLLIDTDTSTPPRLGEIVTYTVDNTTITHRVVGFEGDLLVTQGDNSATVDAWKPPISAIEGRPFFHLPKVGYLLLFLKSPLGWMVLVLVFMGWVLLNELRKITAGLRQTQPR